MIGASVSRWTMSYFAAALVALLGAEALMAAGFGFPSHAIRAPETLVVVHLVAIGWLSLLMCGALIQFVPVLVAGPLRHPELPFPALVFLIAGLAGLVLGFLGMAGHALGPLPWLPLGAAGLATGFALIVLTLARTMWASRPLGLPTRFVAAGLVALAGAVSLGAIFSFALGGWTTNAALMQLTSQAIPIHAALGLGGWLTFTAMGVSYRLLAMFMLAPEADRRTSKFALLAGGLAILALLAGGPVCILLLGRNAAHPLVISLVLATVALVLYGYDIVHLYRSRKRPKIELNARMAAWALGCLGIAGVALLGSAALGEIERRIGALMFLFAFGWLGGLGLAKLYKIVAFLTWLECYGPLLGKRPTPRVQDLVDERRALPWFQLYFASVLAASAAAFFDATLIFRIAAGGMLVATAKLCFELVLIRTLSSVPPAMLPEAGSARPRLFRPALQRSR